MDNLIRFIDPDGMKVEDINGGWKITGVEDLTTALNSLKTMLDDEPKPSDGEISIGTVSISGNGITTSSNGENLMGDPNSKKKQPKQDKTDTSEAPKEDRQLGYQPAPEKLEGFPEAKRVPNKGRARWKLPDGRILEWDKQHGEIEMYDKNGKHQGAFDPKTGNQTKDKIKSRRTNNFVDFLFKFVPPLSVDL